MSTYPRADLFAANSEEGLTDALHYYGVDPKRARRLLSMARNVFPHLHEAEIVEPYLGYKTEIVAKGGERNYQYVIREEDENIHAVIPGKLRYCELFPFGN